jgi:ribose-phosphate pyrophosphokinase
MPDKKPILFSTASYEYLRKAMMGSNRFAEGLIARGQSKDGPVYEDKPFPDGERYHRIMTEVADHEIILLGGTIDDRETMELLDLGQAIVEKGALSLLLLVPYFGYSTMERQVLPGEVVKAKNRARLISAIPPAAFRNRILLLDLHSEGIPHYFENSLVAYHLYARDLIIDAIVDVVKEWQSSAMVASPVADRKRPMPTKRLGWSEENWLDDAHFTLASTDAGRAKWVESLAQDMSARGIPVHPAFIIKRRTGAETEVADISADVDGKFVIIYDDMVRTGGSAIKAARAYLDKGARAIALVCTHGVLPKDSKQRLKDSGCFYKIVVTDSHPRAIELEDDFVKVVSIANLLVESIFNHH